jgi:hypothetical protein
MRERRTRGGELYSKKILAGDRVLLGLYSSGQNVVHAIPDGTERVARVLWSDPVTARAYAIDYFLVTSTLSINTNQTIHLGRPKNDLVVKRRIGIQISIIAPYSGMKRLLSAAAAEDILSFTDIAPSKVRHIPKQNFSLQTVTAIAPSSLITTRETKIVTDGKQSYVASCLLDLYIDFSPWCVSGMTPDGYFAPWNRCLYCYGAGNAMHYPLVYSVDAQSTAEQITQAVRARAAVGLPTRVLRIGKKSDGGHPAFREQLLATLEACCRTGMRAILPTKYLESDKNVADLMKKSGSILMPSLGHDDLEPGALLHGRTQIVRVDDGVWYQDRGVIVAPFVLVDPTQKTGGLWFEPVVELSRKHFRRIQLLSIRIRNKELATRVLGGWGSLVAPGSCSTPAAFEVAGNLARIPLTYHSSITKLIGNNTGRVRLCAHNSRVSHCGACHLPGQKGIAKPTTTRRRRSAA